MHHESLDQHAGLDSALHRLDARAKLIGVLVYTVAVVSEERTDIAAVPPYLVAPLAFILASGVPLRFVFRRVVAIAPLAVVFAAITFAFEPQPVIVEIGQRVIATRLGALTGSVILLKFLVSALALLALATTTPMARLAWAMHALGLPRLLAMQVAMLYRYLFVVMDEFERRRRAASVRSVGSIALRTRLRSLGSHLGSLFARSLARAERVAAAMSVRGFDGTMPRTSVPRAGIGSAAFVLASVALAAGLRLRDVWMGL